MTRAFANSSKFDLLRSIGEEIMSTDKTLLLHVLDKSRKQHTFTPSSIHQRTATALRSHCPCVLLLSKLLLLELKILYLLYRLHQYAHNFSQCHITFHSKEQTRNMHSATTCSSIVYLYEVASITFQRDLK